jgi:hypothetical protein
METILRVYSSPNVMIIQQITPRSNHCALARQRGLPGWIRPSGGPSGSGFPPLLAPHLIGTARSWRPGPHEASPLIRTLRGLWGKKKDGVCAFPRREFRIRTLCPPVRLAPPQRLGPCTPNPGSLSLTQKRSGTSPGSWSGITWIISSMSI